MAAPEKIVAYQRRTGTISIIIATSTTVSSAGGWIADSGNPRAATDGILDISDAITGGLAFPSTFDGTTVTFTATLTAGSHRYTLQILPGAANADVGAIGYLV